MPKTKKSKKVYGTMKKSYGKNKMGRLYKGKK